MFYKRVALILGLLAMFCLGNIPLSAQFYTGSQLQFGKNRIQYKNFFWTYYQYNRYDVYFYPAGKELAEYVSVAADKQLKELETLLQHTLEDHIEFIVFSKHSDFKQSNIGYSDSDQYNIGGKTRIVGSKVILYYEGDHTKLDQQIRAGIAELIINHKLYGGNLRSKIANSSVLVIPDWYMQGLVAYIASDWNTTLDSKVKDGILSGTYDKIAFLEGQDAVYAGHAYWKHLTNQYGDEIISDILFMTKATHSIDDGSMSVLGLGVSSVWNDCIESFLNRYNRAQAESNASLPAEVPLLKRPKKSRVYNQLKVSPNADYAVYVTNELGQYKIWLHSFYDKKAKMIFKGDYKIARINDYSYPLISWHPSGDYFSFIIEYHGYISMRSYDVGKKEFFGRNITGFEKILDYAYSDDGKSIAMSAVKKGKTDIYILNAGSAAFYQVTNDLYDDFSPRFVNNSTAVVFASNRPSDTLYFDAEKNRAKAQEVNDVFIFDMETKSPLLIRVTDTRDINESKPGDYDANHISYLSDENGTANRFIASVEKQIAFIDTSTHYRYVVKSRPITNYSRGILEHDINRNAGMISELLYVNGRYRMFAYDLEKPTSISPINLVNSSYRNHKIRIEELKAEENKERELIIIETQAEEEEDIDLDDASFIDIENYIFEDEKEERLRLYQKQESTAANENIDSTAFEIAKRRNYNTAFSMDYVVSQLDNSFLSQSYQKFTGGNSPIYLNSGLNAYIKAGISDVFEDYQIIGGTRFAGNFSTNEFFITYSDRKMRLDKKLTLYRQKIESPTENGGVAKVFTHEARVAGRLPFSEVAAVRGAFSYRNNAFVYSSITSADLVRSNDYEHWANTLVEYVYDNSRPTGINLYNGFRGKAFAEYSRRLDETNTNFFVLGADVRYYQKIHRDFIWANRFAASTSFGNQKLVYYLGGVDSWFLPQFNTNTNVKNSNQYAYQTLATNLRGFSQNARNGNSFAVVNSELRLPVFKYFIPRAITSEFIRTFQLLGFGDVGAAWVGSSPFTAEASSNKVTVGSNQTPLLVDLYQELSPVVAGVGFGLRARLFGYFVRLDRAWGLQDGFVETPITYLSLSLDF